MNRVIVLENTLMVSTALIAKLMFAFGAYHVNQSVTSKLSLAVNAMGIAPNGATAPAKFEAAFDTCGDL